MIIEATIGPKNFYWECLVSELNAQNQNSNTLSLALDANYDSEVLKEIETQKPHLLMWVYDSYATELLQTFFLCKEDLLLTKLKWMG